MIDNKKERPVMKNRIKFGNKYLKAIKDDVQFQFQDYKIIKPLREIPSEKVGLTKPFSEYTGYYSTYEEEMVTMDGKKYLQDISRLNKQIQTNPKIVGGMPSVKETRIPVSLVLGCLRDGMTIDQICEDFHLSKEQVISCLNYAIDVLDHPFLAED